MARYEADVIPCCVQCDSKNETKICRKCSVVYCKHYASVTDVRYCANCISDYTLKETIIEKVVEHERPDGTITFSRKYQARHIMLQGTDWLFNAHLIAEMSDAEIDATIEYHRANVGLMLDERESRKKERWEKLSKIKIVHTPPPAKDRKDSKTRTKIKEKDANSAEALAAALGQLAKAGLTIEQITQMLGGKK